MTVVLIVATYVVAGTMVTFGVCALIGANESVARATRRADKMERQRDEADAQADYWHAAFVACTRNTNVRSIREAPAFDRIADQLARSEAARADWDEPSNWGNQ